MPVIRNAESFSLAQIEKKLKDLLSKDAMAKLLLMK